MLTCKKQICSNTSSVILLIFLKYIFYQNIITHVTVGIGNNFKPNTPITSCAPVYFIYNLFVSVYLDKTR